MIRINDVLINPDHIVSIDLNRLTFSGNNYHSAVVITLAVTRGELVPLQAENHIGNWEPLELEFSGNQAEALRPWLVDLFPCNGRSIQLPDPGAYGWPKIIFVVWCLITKQKALGATRAQTKNVNRKVYMKSISPNSTKVNIKITPKVAKNEVRWKAIASKAQGSRGYDHATAEEFNLPECLGNRGINWDAPQACQIHFARQMDLQGMVRIWHKLALRMAPMGEYP